MINGFIEEKAAVGAREAMGNLCIPAS